jgi:hypothetical protein
MTTADGRQIGSWTEGTIAHFFALFIDRAKGVPAA